MLSIKHYSRVAAFALFCLPIVAGCEAEGPELADVEGVVTLDGEPVPNATVTFISRRPDGSTSSGQTDAEGHYTLMYTFKKEGAMLGEHDVRVETQQFSPQEKAELRAAGETVVDAVKIPAKYTKVGELEATVEAGGNEINFELTSQP